MLEPYLQSLVELPCLCGFPLAGSPPPRSTFGLYGGLCLVFSRSIINLVLAVSFIAFIIVITRSTALPLLLFNIVNFGILNLRCKFGQHTFNHQSGNCSSGMPARASFVARGLHLLRVQEEEESVISQVLQLCFMNL